MHGRGESVQVRVALHAPGKRVDDRVVVVGSVLHGEIKAKSFAYPLVLMNS